MFFVNEETRLNELFSYINLDALEKHLFFSFQQALDEISTGSWIRWP